MKMREGPEHWEARYKEGDLDEAQWLYKVLYGGFGRVASDLVQFRAFAEAAVERIPKITYPVYPGYWREKEGVLWTSIEDVYAFADRWTGGVFSFAEFFHDLAQAKTPQQFKGKCDETRAKVLELRTEGQKQTVIGEKVGLTQGRVSQIINDTLIKTINPSPQVRLSKDTARVATAIVKARGADYASALAAAIPTAILEHSAP